MAFFDVILPAQIAMPPHPRSLRDLFDAALDLPPDERARFLESVNLDATQRSRLARMLASEEGPQGALPDAAAAALADALIDTDLPGVLPPGSRIGPFDLGEVIGEGGSSTVFRASRSFDGVRQEVALKLLRRGVYSPDAQRQFRRERQVLVQLDDARIARLIEGGVTDGGLAYIALEFVEGQPITAYARERRLDVRARLRLFLDVCRAVDAAHRALIVHRDIKPSNVFVTRDGAVKLLDFGIAKLLDANDDDTQTRVPAFTPAYASPEQRSGALITTATDVYALGVLLGELMTGERFSDASTRTPSNSVSEEHAAGVLPAAAATTRRQLRGDLDNIVMKALDPDPAKRYASGGAFADDIERTLDGKPVAAHPPSPWYRARKFVSRHRGGVATSVAFLLAIFAALGIALWQAAVAQQQARAAREQAERADSIRQFLLGVFEQAEPDANRGQPISAQQLLQKGEQELSSSADVQSGTRLDLTVLIGHLYWDLGDYAHAEPLLKQAIAAAGDERIAPEIRARTLAAVARVESEKRLLDPAIEHAKQAIAMAARAGSAGDESASAARRIEAASMRGQGNSKDAEPILRDALERDRASHGDRDQSVIDDWMELGGVLTELSRFDEGVVALQTSVDLARTVHGPMHTSVAVALQELAGPMGYAGNYAGAERTQREALDIYRAIYGPDHRETLVAMGNLYWVLEREGRFDDALQGRLAMMDRLVSLSASQPEVIASAYASIGHDYFETGRFGEAETAIRSSLATWAKLQGSNDEWDSADPTIALANALRWDGRYAEAEVEMRKGIAIEARHEPPESGWLNRDRASLGDLLRQVGRTDEALVEIRAAAAARAGAKADPLMCGLLAQLSLAELAAGHVDVARGAAQQSVDMARTLYPARHLKLGSSLFALARADLAAGAPADAEPLLREALAVRSPPYPAADPRTLEVEVALVIALRDLGRTADAQNLRTSIEPLLAASTSPYVHAMHAELDAR